MTLTLTFTSLPSGTGSVVNGTSLPLAGYPTPGPLIANNTFFPSIGSLIPMTLAPSLLPVLAYSPPVLALSPSVLTFLPPVPSLALPDKFQGRSIYAQKMSSSSTKATLEAAWPTLSLLHSSSPVTLLSASSNPSNPPDFFIYYNMRVVMDTIGEDSRAYVAAGLIGKEDGSGGGMQDL